MWVREVSPTLVERYLAAAQKVRSPGGRSPVPPPRDHIVVLRLISRRGSVRRSPVRTLWNGCALHLSVDGTYEIHVDWRGTATKTSRTHRPAPVVSTLDGTRLQLSTSSLTKRVVSYTRRSVRQFERSCSCKPASRAWRPFVRKTLLYRKGSSAVQRTHMDRHPRIRRCLFGCADRAFRCRGPQTADRRRIFGCRPQRRRMSRLREDISRRWRAAHIDANYRADLQVPLSF